MDTLPAMKTTSFSNPALVMTLLLTLMVLIFSAPAYAVDAQTQSNGKITGSVVNGTTGQFAPGLDVTLTGFTSEGVVSEVTTMTNDDGEFVFQDVDASDGIVYAASAQWRGVLYSTGMIRFLGSTEQNVSFEIFETTTDRGVVSVASRALVLSEIDPRTGLAMMLDITVIEDTGDVTFVAGDTGRSLEFPIPRNAGRPTLLPGFDFGNAVIENATIFASSPLRPGGATATINYPVQYTGTGFNLDIQHAYPTDVFRILVPADVAGESHTIDVAGRDLEELGTQLIGDRSYMVWGVTDLQTNATVRVSFRSLPESQFKPNELRVLEPTLLAAGALVAASALTVVMVRRKHIVPVEPSLDDAVTAGFVESREELVLQLQVLQDQYDNGMVDEETYLSERRFLLERLRTVTRFLRDQPVDAEE